MQYLDFEKELENLDIQIDTLKNPFENDGLSSLKNEEIQNIESEIDKKINEIYLNLDGWQKTKSLDTPADQDQNFILKIFLVIFSPYLETGYLAKTRLSLPDLQN